MIKVQILSPGCEEGEFLYKMVKKECDVLGVGGEIEWIKDFNDIAEKGAYNIPALVVDDKLVLEGRLPDPKEVKRWLKK